jgi:hypothetical protein
MRVATVEVSPSGQRYLERSTQMKSKTLIGIAVASTFGWAAAAQAGFDHFTWGADTEQHSSSTMTGHASTVAGTASFPDEAVGSTASMGVGSVGESLSSGYGEWTSDGSSDWTAMSDEAMDAFSQQLFASDPYLVAWMPIPASDWEVTPIDLASDGIYSDYYLVSWTPVTASDWDVYIVEPETDYLVFTDDGHDLLSSYDIVLFPSDFFGSPELMSESGFASDDELNV